MRPPLEAHERLHLWFEFKSIPRQAWTLRAFLKDIRALAGCDRELTTEHWRRHHGGAKAEHRGWFDKIGDGPRGRVRGASRRRVCSRERRERDDRITRGREARHCGTQPEIRLKLAVTLRSDETVRLHVLEVPVHAPLQPSNRVQSA